MSSQRNRIPQDVLDDIAARLDIVDVVGRYVAMTRRGANYMGLCPFHAEKTPSFSVSPDKQIFHCFGCGVGGNIYRFLMDIEGLTFPEAAKRLAQEAGVQIPQTHMSPAQQEARAQRERFYRVMDLAEKFYAHQWQEDASQIYRDYAEQRALTPDAIAHFGIGATAPGWDALVRFLSRCKVPFADMETLGLALRSRQGHRCYDRFRERLMFPIHDALGRTIGFGGRLVGESDQPQKYLNSPESPLFHKSEVLYGLDKARGAIRQQGKILICEGYMDVVACYQAGIDVAVAPMGTALTLEQVKSLMRYSYDFILAFDGDDAGRRATLKALDIIENLGARARVLDLPADSDPDDVIRRQGAEALQLALDDAMDSIDFRLREAMTGRDLDSVSDKILVLDDLMDHLLSIRQRARLELTIEKIADELKLSRQAVLDDIRHRRRQGPSREAQRIWEQRPQEEAAKTQSLSPQEEKEGLFLSLLYADPSRFVEAEQAGGEDLLTGPFVDLYRHAKSQIAKGDKLTAGDMPPEWSHLLAKITPMADRDEEAMRKDLFEASLLQLAWAANQRQYQALLRELEEPDLADEAANESMEALAKVMTEKTRLERLMRKEQ